jgi:DNA/RNA-binding domain of Phe-tRNA-synthetase-like protein
MCGYATEVSPLLTIAVEVAQAISGARLGLLAFAGATVREQDEALWATVQMAVERVAARYPDGDYRGDETIKAVRHFYHRLGVDPTKWRPASEALLRRVVRGKELHHINNAVDVVNWCSLESGLPFGLYDRARIQGPMVFRLGKPGETYQGIRREVLTAGGKPVLADALGVFGSPTADSERTMVRLETQELLVVIYGPAEVVERAVQEAARQTQERLERWCGAHMTDEQWVTAMP